MKCAKLECKIQNMDNLWSPEFHNVTFLKYTHNIPLHAYVQVPRNEYFYFDCIFSPVMEIKWDHIYSLHNFSMVAKLYGGSLIATSSWGGHDSGVDLNTSSYNIPKSVTIFFHHHKKVTKTVGY